MEFAECLDDGSLGPAVDGCRGNFDFTLKFEKIFFSLIPASIFIVFALLRIVLLIRQPQIVGGYLLRGAKLVSVGITLRVDHV
jgi:ATP-binding cassette subfamily C (CFTR/MRP) protein 1